MGRSSKLKSISFKLQFIISINQLILTCFKLQCTFAHGAEELAAKETIPQNYKTKLCEKFHGPLHHCSYGKRCTFLHETNTLAATPETKQVKKNAARKTSTRSSNLNRIVESISAKSSETQSNASRSAVGSADVETLSFGQAQHASKNFASEDQSSPDQVASAQKLFKRFGRRLDVFKSIKVEMEQDESNDSSGNERKEKGQKNGGKKKEKQKTVRM